MSNGPAFGVFTETEAALDQCLVHGQQDEPFLVGSRRAEED